MSEYGGNHHCHECDGSHGHHYSGCSHEGTGSRGFCGSDFGKMCFFIILLFGVFIAALCPPIGALIIVAGAEITGV